MSKQINQYTKTRTSGTVQDDDFIDIDSTEDSGTSYESAKMTMLNLLNYVSSSVDNIYNADGTLTGNRILTSSTFWTKWVGGDVIVEMNNEADNYGFAVNNSGSVEKARIGFDQVTDSGFLSLISPTGEFFLASNDKVEIGSIASPPTTSIMLSVEDGINTEDAYYSNNDFLIGQLIGGLAIGKQALDSTTSGTLSLAIGDSALTSLTSGFQDIAIGLDAGIFATSVQQSVFIGYQSAISLITGNFQVMIGHQSGINISSGDSNVFLGQGTGAVSMGAMAGSIAIGRGARVDKNFQMVIGSNAAWIAEAYFGFGIESASITPSSLQMRVTNIVAGASNVAPGFNWVWNASQGTGTGVGSDHVWKVAPAGTSGTARNALVETFRLKGDGNVNMPNLPTSSAGLSSGDLWNNSGVINIV